MKGVFITCVFVVAVSLLRGQEDSIRSFMISGEPLYMINNGLRFDLDYQIKQYHWIVVTGEFYLSIHDTGNVLSYNSNGSYYDKLLGYSAGIYHRLYLKKKSGMDGPYISSGISFHHFMIDIKKYDWFTYEEDGLIYYEYGPVYDTERIFKFGASAIIGYQYMIVEKIYFDLYLGFGIRYSFLQSNLTQPVTFSRYYWDYGYTGTLPVAGFRVVLQL